MKARTSKAKPATAEKPKWPLEIVTLLIALWGAFLSTWVYIQDRRDEAPRVYVQLEVRGAGKNANGQPLGTLIAVFSNVGKATLSMGPRVPIEITDHHTGKKTIVYAWFVKRSSNRDLGESATSDIGPATLSPGGSAVAKAEVFNVGGIDQLDHFNVNFELPNHEHYRAHIALPESLRAGGESSTFQGWSAGAFAEEIDAPDGWRGR